MKIGPVFNLNLLADKADDEATDTHLILSHKSPLTLGVIIRTNYIREGNQPGKEMAASIPNVA